MAAGATIGLAILGDSFLYGVLPLEAEHLGISLPLVGILLSANRLVRLASNTWAGAVFERFGPRRPFAVATVLALITTLTYGIGWGFLVFLLARIGWGIAWSGLRQGAYQAVWTGDETAKGRLTGVLWGLVRLGSALSVLVGGYLRDRFGYPVSLSALACATALAFPIALSVRWPDVPPRTAVAHQRPLEGWWTALRMLRSHWLLGVGFLHNVFEGVLVSTASLFLADQLGANEPLLETGVGVATIAGVLLAVRWMSGLVVGPVVGALSDRLGQPRTAVFLTFVLLAGIAGAVGLSRPLPVFFLSLVFLAGGGLYVTLGTAATHAAVHTERPHLFVGFYTTATDAGSAIGPLLAYSLGSAIGLTPVYVAAGSVLTLAVLRYWWSERVSERASE